MISTAADAAVVTVCFVGVVGRRVAPNRAAEMSVLKVAVAGNALTDADWFVALGAFVVACQVTLDKFPVTLTVLLLSTTHVPLSVGVDGVLILI